MGRRPRGEFVWFVCRDMTEQETAKYGPGTVSGGSHTKMYWAGDYSGDGSTFYPYRNLGYKYDFSTQADEAILKLVLKCPDLMGKLRIDFEFVPETEWEKKKRLKEARERRKAIRAAIAAEDQKRVPEQNAAHEQDRAREGGGAPVV